MKRKNKLWEVWLASLVVVCFVAASQAAQAGKKEPRLTVASAELLDSEDGYAIPLDSMFFPGERVHFLFKIGGYTRGEFDRVKLKYRIDSFGPRGDQFSMAEIGEIDTELAPQDKDWLPLIRHSPRLPDHAEAGTYRVVLSVTDELGGARVSREMKVLVRGANVEPAKNLTIRNFRFSSKEGGKKISAPVFRAGTSVWASFHITGYQIREDNSFEVDAELKVLDEKGKVLFELEPEGEKGSPFYPRRWLPASFRLDLDDDIAPGNYAILVSIHDRLGQRSYEKIEPFRVR